MGILVKNGGLQSTVQDLGRVHGGRFGISKTGALDGESASIANWLVGNDENAPLIEVAYMGPTLEFTSAATFAVVGGAFTVLINGAPASMGGVHGVARGDVLQVGGASNGTRCYIAFGGGGLEVDLVMGSASTHIKAGFGGFKGRALKANDSLVLASDGHPIGSRPWMRMMDFVGNTVNEKFQPPQIEPLTTIRVVLGPHHERFSPMALERLTNTPYILGSQSDRMGYRLSGEKLIYASGCKADILSEPNGVGAIQVPGDGQPLILLNDAGTTGGYAKIASVVSVDLPLLAQLKPNDGIQFFLISLEEAQVLLKKKLKDRESLRQALLGYHSNHGREFNVKVNGKAFHLYVVERE